MKGIRALFKAATSAFRPGSWADVDSTQLWIFRVAAWIELQYVLVVLKVRSAVLYLLCRSFKDFTTPRQSSARLARVIEK
jgi:hypothetical protein